MFNSQHLPVYAVSSHPRNLRQTKALRTMPPTVTRSATFEELALPLFASLSGCPAINPSTKTSCRNLLQGPPRLRLLSAWHQLQGVDLPHPPQYLPHVAHGIATSRTVFLEDHPDTLDTDAGPTPEDTLIRLDNQAALHQALEQLQPQLREVLLLCDVEEIKYKDIAAILDVPIGTVMSRISRARRTLRLLLQPQLGESL